MYEKRLQFNCNTIHQGFNLNFHGKDEGDVSKQF